MVNLTSLDLSCNGISFYDTEGAATTAQHMLIPMKKLCRLDLSGCHLKQRLRVVLGGVSSPLKHLRLSGCMLKPEDLTALYEHPLLGVLEELDLSMNNLGMAPNTMLNLLSRNSSSLKVLEMEDCHIGDEMLNNMLQTCFLSQSKNLSNGKNGFSQLVYLNIVSNIFNFECDTLKSVVNVTSHLGKVKAVRMCYPNQNPDLDVAVHMECEKKFELELKLMICKNALQMSSSNFSSPSSSLPTSMSSNSNIFTSASQLMEVMLIGGMRTPTAYLWE